MDIAFIKGYDRVIGESQGYQGLPLRVTTVIDPASGHEVIQMQSEWRPSPEELDMLNQGKGVIVTLFTVQHPPIMLTVGDPDVN